MEDRYRLCDLSQQVDIEEATRGQRDNTHWYEMRRGRVTANRCAEVLEISPSTIRLDLCARNFLKPYSSKTNATREWGVINKTRAIEEYIREGGFERVDAKGLIVDYPTGHLGTSPDGFVVANDGNQHLLEIKCPYSARHFKSLANACTSLKNFFIARVCMSDGSIGFALRLDTVQGRKYYAQVMLSLYLTKMSHCDFVVWTPRAYVVIHIARNLVWEEKNLPILLDFWQRFLGPKYHNKMCVEEKMKQHFVKYATVDDSESDSDKCAKKMKMKK